MSEKAKEIDIREHLNVIYRRKWYFMVPFSLIVTVSSVVTFLIPKTYMSSATIVVQKKSDPLGVERISINKIPALTSLITSRSNVENIVRKAGLDRNVSDPVRYETLIKYVVSNLKIHSKGGTLTISFAGRKPKLCMQIVNMVTGIFAEQDIKVESKYDKTIEFIEKQSKVYERKLLEASDLIRQFREINVDQLPESSSINAAIIEKSKISLEEIEEKLALGKEEIIKIEKILSNESETIDTELDKGPKTKRKLGPIELKLVALNQKMETLLVTYTEKYPEVRKVRDEIELLKEQLKESSMQVSKSKKHADKNQEDSLSMHVTSVNPEYIRLTRELAKLKKAQMSYKEERNSLLENISQAEENLRGIPRHEQELKTLANDFKTYQRIYSQLQSKLQASKLRKEMEAWGGGTYFKVVRPASLPLHPIAPQMWKMITIGVILGALIGVSAAFWAELMDNSIRDLDGAKEFFNAPILAAIPKVYVEFEVLRKRRLNMFLFVMGSFYIIFIIILITREILLQVAPEVLEFQTYKDMLNQFLQTLGISPLS